MPEDFSFDDEDGSGQQQLDKWQQRFSNLGNKIGWIVIAAVVIIYLATGIYQVQPAEVGLVKRFGKFTRQVDSGLNYHLPAPIESVQIVDVQSVRKIEVGYETISPPPNPRYRIKQAEARMLTGDDNIVHFEIAVQYSVSFPKKFAFNIIDPKVLVKEASEAIIRQEVVRRTVEEALTNERAEIAADAVEDLQELLNEYNAGIHIETIKVQDAKPPEPVIPAFDDVTSAKEDKKTKVNQAEAYRNEVVPQARGNAAELVNQAEAYEQRKVNAAQGEVARFEKVLREYNTASQEVTRKRLYIEALEDILPGMEKVVLTEADGSGQIFKLLNLNELEGEQK